MATTASTSLGRDLIALLGEGAVLPGNTRAYLTDATESRNLRGRADAIALPADAQQVAAGRRLVLRARRRDHCPRRRHRVHRRGRSARWRRGPEPRAPEEDQASGPRAVACRGRGRRGDRRSAPPCPREWAVLPARPRLRRAVSARRQHRHQRRRPARVQVRGDGRVDHRTRVRARARRARQGRRADPQGRRRLRPQVADDRLRGHAGGRHRARGSR